MKKLFILTTGLILMGLSSNAKAQTYNAMENQLYAAANNGCLNEWRQAYGGLVSFSTENFTTSSCVGGNEGIAIDIYAFIDCPPQQRLFCKPAPPFKVASASRNCDGVITVTCVRLP